MRAVFTLLFFAVMGHVCAQDGRLYKGAINKKMNVVFYLEGLDEGTYADPIVGSYRYYNQKNYILLNGYRNNAGNISLVEQSTANFSGTFLGKIIKNKIIGSWISADGKSSYTFELTEVVPAGPQVDKFKNAIKEKADEFRAY